MHLFRPPRNSSSPERAAHPLTDHHFRALWSSGLLLSVASQISTFAAVLIIWELTSSVLWVGLLGLARLVPIVLFAGVGGVLADRVDLRTVVIASASGHVVAAASMMFAVGGGTSAGFVLGTTAVQAVAASLGAPARKAFVFTLLRREQLGAGLALTLTSYYAGVVFGPLVGGVTATSSGGPMWSCACAAILACIAVAAAIRVPSERDSAQGKSGKDGGGVVVGLCFAWRTPTLRSTFLLDLNATVLAMPTALFPAFNTERLGGDTLTLSLLYSALAVGGLVASLSSRLFTAVRRLGVLMFGAAVLWSLALGAFAVSTHTAAAMCALLIAGAADTVCVVVRGMIVQSTVDASVRGRLSAVDHIVDIAGPELGNVRAGGVVHLANSGSALAVGPITSLIGIVLLACVSRDLRRYTVTTAVAKEPPRE